MLREPWSGPYAFTALALVVAAIALWFTWDIASELTEQRIRAEKTAESPT